MRNTQTILYLLQHNIKRWKWRLGSVSILISVAFVLHVLYASSLESTLQQGSERGGELHLPYDIMIVMQPGEHILREEEWPAPPQRGNTRIDTLMHAHYESATSASVFSNVGSFDVLGLQEGSSYYNNEDILIAGRHVENLGEIVLPERIAESAQVNLGDTVTLQSWEQHPWQTGLRHISLCVVGIYNAYDVQPALVRIEDANVLSSTGQENLFLFSYNRTFTTLAAAVYWLRKGYPTQAFIYTTTPRDLSYSLLDQVSRPGRNMLVLIALFVGIGAFTIANMTFLERRKEMAALKTVGTSNSQITALLGLEYVCADALGLALGSAVLASVSARLSWMQDLHPWAYGTIVLTAMAMTLFAATIAIALPVVTARVATINQLLFARRIPLASRQIASMEKPQSGLVYRERVENIRLIKLIPPEEAQDILILKSVGDTVKQGEVVAFQETWFGLYILEWIAPCDGTVTIREQSGVIGISPEDKDAPFFPYPSHMLEFERRRVQTLERASLEARAFQDQFEETQDSRLVMLDQEQRRTRAAKRQQEHNAREHK